MNFLGLIPLRGSTSHPDAEPPSFLTPAFLRYKSANIGNFLTQDIFVAVVNLGVLMNFLGSIFRCHFCCFSQVKAILIKQEIKKSDGEYSLLVSAGHDMVFDYNHLLKRVVNACQ